MSRRALSRGFTLVEVLVVVGVIALLISILVPALHRAYGAARAVVCSSNMRQIDLAMIAYAEANHAYLPMPPIVFQNTSNPANIIQTCPYNAFYNKGDFSGNSIWGHG